MCNERKMLIKQGRKEEREGGRSVCNERKILSKNGRFGYLVPYGKILNRNNIVKN